MTVMAPVSAFCWVLVAAPVKVLVSARFRPSFGNDLPSTLGGVTAVVEPLLSVVPACLLAWVVSCSSTVTTSPMRKARLSEVSDSGPSLLNTPPEAPRGGPPRAVGTGSLTMVLGLIGAGASAPQPASAVLSATRAGSAARDARKGSSSDRDDKRGISAGRLRQVVEHGVGRRQHLGVHFVG